MKVLFSALLGLTVLLVHAQAAEQTAVANACVQTTVANTGKTIALLDCPTTSRADVESTVAVYDSKTPVCTAKIKLLDGTANFFRAQVKSIEARVLSDKSMLVIPTFAGGDGTLPWTAHAVLRVDEKCGLTLLARPYSRMHYDEDDTSKCEGEKHKLAFAAGDVIEVRRDRVHCTPTDERVEPLPAKRLEIRDLIAHPEQRLVEP